MFAGSRPKFAARVLERAAVFRPDLIVFGHVNFSPLSLATRVVRPTAAQWIFTYGLEVWQKLDCVKLLAMRKAEKIISISEYTKASLCQHNGISPSSVAILPCALDPLWAASFALGPDTPVSFPDAETPLLLSVSRLASEETGKGVDQVIRALPDIVKSVPGVRYAIVGDGRDRSRLERLTRELKVDDRVEFRGRVSPEALARAYAECSLFVLPSRQEGFGIVFLEAAAFGKPSIGGKHGGTPEVISDGETGHLVDYDDIAGIASTIVDSLTHPDSLVAMGARARCRTDDLFTFSRLRRTLNALVTETLESTAR